MAAAAPSRAVLLDYIDADTKFYLPGPKARRLKCTTCKLKCSSHEDSKRKAFYNLLSFLRSEQAY